MATVEQAAAQAHRSRWLLVIVGGILVLYVSYTLTKTVVVATALIWNRPLRSVHRPLRAVSVMLAAMTAAIALAAMGSFLRNVSPGLGLVATVVHRRVMGGDVVGGVLSAPPRGRPSVVGAHPWRGVPRDRDPAAAPRHRLLLRRQAEQRLRAVRAARASRPPCCCGPTSSLGWSSRRRRSMSPPCAPTTIRTDEAVAPRTYARPVITLVAVAGYRSLRDVVVPLHGLDVVTGANGSGKSSLYRALAAARRLRVGTGDRLARPGGRPALRSLGRPRDARRRPHAWVCGRGHPTARSGEPAAGFRDGRRLRLPRRPRPPDPDRDGASTSTRR